MEGYRQVIEDALEMGADAKEVIEAVHEAGWNFVSRIEVQRWRNPGPNTEVLAYVTRVNGQVVKSQRAISERSLAHMPEAGVTAAWEYLLHEHLKTLGEVLGQKRP